MSEDRNIRRMVFAAERRARATGNWGPWEVIEQSVAQMRAWRHQGGMGFSGWMLDVHTIWKNEWCVVMIRDVPTEWGTVKHAVVRTAMNAELKWSEKQRLKNEVFDAASIAIEVYPHADRVIDAADVYHLWILPVGMELPFGIHARDCGSDGGFRPKMERDHIKQGMLIRLTHTNA
jgi:hypothetical protein